MLCKMNICSVVLLPCRKPACSALSLLSAPFFKRLIRILPNTLLAITRSVIPCHIDVFLLCKLDLVMMSYCLQLKIVKYWINDISINIKAVFLKLQTILGTINVHYKRNKMTPSMVFPWQLFCLQSLSVQKTNIPICNPWNDTKGATWYRHSSHIVLTPINRVCGVDGS